MNDEPTEKPPEKALVPAPKPPLVVSNRSIMPIVPTTFDEVWRIAGAVTQAGLAPKGAETQQKATIIILHGLEVGLSPMVALQSIAVINGKPSLYGDGALAVVRASGLLEKFSERLIYTPGDPNNITASCTIKRRGEAALTRTFSRADADKAGLWGKPGTWQSYPNRMLGMRARAFALRDCFADVMRGLSIREEIEDIPVDVDLVPPPPPPAAELGKTPLELAIEKANQKRATTTLEDDLVVWDEQNERPMKETDFA